MGCSRCLLTSECGSEVLEFFWPGRGLAVEFREGEPCSFCADVERYLDRARLAAEAAAFFSARSGPVFLAYSGGKDSTATLYHLRRELDVPVVAVLFDNGFIPTEVKDYARRVCADLGAELILDAGDDARVRLERGFARRLEVSFRGPRNDVCTLCSKTFIRRFHRFMGERGADSLALGNNFWAHSPHTSPSPEPPTMRATATTTLDDGRVVHRINLPFAAGITYARTREILAEIGFHRASFTGYTTNCVLSDFQDWARERDGQKADWGRQYLSLEVSAGYLTRDEALDLLDRRAHGYDEDLMARIERSLTAAQPLAGI